MDKRSIAVMLGAIVVALVGLLAVQVIWTRETIGLREDQFVREVAGGLLRVSEHLERAERMQDLRKHRKGRRMLARIDSLRAAAQQRQALLDAPAADELPSSDPPADLPPDITMAEEAPLYQEMIDDLARGIFSKELSRDIRRRIDPVALDSMIGQELTGLGVDGSPRWAIFNEKREPVRGLAMPDSATADLREARFRVRLFRHDLAGLPYVLHVQADHARSALLSGAWPMLIASVLFVAIIALAFSYTIRSVVRQKRLNDIRNDLVNNLTHELKTPISTIGLACEALADPSIPRTEEQVRAYTAMIRDENKRLGALVENVLQSAVQDSGRMVMKPVDLDVHAVIDDVVRSSAMQVSRRDGRIETELKAEIHRLKADRIHLTNLLYNLIDNAVKYCEKAPRLRIATRSDDEGITLSVSDNGIGIPSSEPRKIFDRLYRVPTGNLHNAKGFGLGLSYVKSVVDRHGGRIRVESAPGSGSTFHIYLPFQA